MKYIPLNQNKKAIIDDEWYPILYLVNWNYGTNGYATRYDHLTKKRIYMHRLILNTPPRLETDHINRNRLDNRKENLRIVTKEQNQRNTKLSTLNTSGYKGVTWRKDKNAWIVYARIHGKKTYLGLFKNVHDAGKKYKDVISKLS